MPKHSLTYTHMCAHTLTHTHTCAHTHTHSLSVNRQCLGEDVTKNRANEVLNSFSVQTKVFTLDETKEFVKHHHYLTLLLRTDALSHHSLLVSQLPVAAL